LRQTRQIAAPDAGVPLAGLLERLRIEADGAHGGRDGWPIYKSRTEG
jgi:hypothetical protein